MNNCLPKRRRSNAVIHRMERTLKNGKTRSSYVDKKVKSSNSSDDENSNEKYSCETFCERNPWFSCQLPKAEKSLMSFWSITSGIRNRKYPKLGLLKKKNENCLKRNVLSKKDEQRHKTIRQWINFYCVRIFAISEVDSREWSFVQK